MKKGTGWLLLGSALALILIIIVVKSYSSLSALNEDVKNRESDLNVQLTRKKEQVSSLIEVSKELINDEEELINEIETINSKLVEKGIKEKSDNNDKLSTLLNKLLEKITPELLKNEEITVSINGLLLTEQRIKTAMTNYNKVVDDYNSKVSNFPSLIIASIRGFNKKDVFNTSVEIKDIRVSEE